ncbi:hypothetical protein F5H01DRAFT_356715 [Linnemannia elongata]|nr:hypothetical protein F5H01DRAFT_356715 [Linnemannia elongata]
MALSFFTLTLLHISLPTSSMLLLLVFAPVIIRFVSRAIAFRVVSNATPNAVSKYTDRLYPHRLAIALCVRSVCMSVCKYLCMYVAVRGWAG